MKKEYVTPTAEKLEFQYEKVVVAPIATAGVHGPMHLVLPARIWSM